MFVDCCRWWTRIHLLDARSFCVHKQRERFCSLLTIHSFQLCILILKAISSCVWSWNSAQVVTFIRYDNGSLANISLSRQQGEIGNKFFFFFLQKVLVILGCLLSPGYKSKDPQVFHYILSLLAGSMQLRSSLPLSTYIWWVWFTVT